MNNIIELLYKDYLDNPNRLAFVDSNRSLTYEEAFKETLAKASFLLEKGIYGQPIIVKVNRTIDSLISFFAILLSNNYYIPIDEEVPAEKLSKIINLSGAKYYLSFVEDSLNIEKINFAKPTKICEFIDFSKQFNAENYSYLMFTSGSTGEPKGVIKTHKNIISFVDNFVDTFSFLGNERIANQTPFFFDASAKDIYLTLKLGGTMFIPDKTVFSLPTETVKYLNDNWITFICWVPSILTMIAKTRTLSYVKPEALKYVFFVGEVFQPKYLNMWIESMKNTRFFNVYGSTEVMGIALEYEIKDIFIGETIPLGKPLKNNKVYLENDEIVIDSDQVAKGYVNNNQSGTFKKNSQGKTLLYTGDYAKHDKDGNIVFVSRKDFQIKHLGYRIELQEIEAAVTNFEYVDTCCAIYDEINDKIVLFVKAYRELDNPSKTIIKDCKEELQFYMVPNKVIMVDEMPLNKNGKIDRVSLKKGLE